MIVDVEVDVEVDVCVPVEVDVCPPVVVDVVPEVPVEVEVEVEPPPQAVTPAITRISTTNAILKVTASVLFIFFSVYWNYMSMINRKGV